jgi:hypothetical protein
MKKGLYIVLLVCFGLPCFSQNKCDNIIESATDLYNAGRYDECIQILDDGLQTCNLSKGKKEKAFILLINSNIEKDSILAVDKNFKALLVNRPNFKLKDYDVLDDFKEKFKNYFIFPKLSIGLRAFYGHPQVALDFFPGSTSRQIQQNINTEGHYKTDEIYKINVGIDYRITEKWGQYVEFGVYNLSYYRTLLNNYWTQNTEEHSKYLQWDMGTKRFYRAQKKFSPYLMSGLSNQFLVKNKFSLTQTKTSVSNLYGGSDSVGVRQTWTEDNISKLRNHYTCYLIAGGGFVYNLGNVSLGIDARFYVPFITLNKQNGRFSEYPKLVTDFSYVDNDIIMTRYDLSLTVSYNFLNKAKNKK